MGNRTVDIRYEDPKDIDEAQTRRGTLTLDIQTIQAQLGDESRKAIGRREYNEWRRRTLFALTAKCEELRRVKGWITQHRTGASKQLADHRQNVFEFLDYVKQLEQENFELKARLSTIANVPVDSLETATV
jgi:hypothetical protein